MGSYPKTRLSFRDSIKRTGESSKKSFESHGVGQESSLRYTKQKSKEMETKNIRNDLKVREEEKRKKVIGKERESEKRKSVVGKEQEQEKKKMVTGKDKESEKRKMVAGKEQESEKRKRLFEKEKELAKRYKENGKCSERSLSLCGICMDKKTKTEMFVNNNCSHSYCYDCTNNHVAAKIRQNITKVKCPDLGCNNFFEPQNCRSFISRQVLDRWEAALCESVIGSKKIYCPFRDCSAPLIYDGKEVFTSAECPYCHRLFCAQCRVPWHAGSKCKSKDNHNMDKKFMDLAKREKWQKCPYCSFYVQRINGCESIKCRCGHRFCYICGKGWIFGHLCDPKRVTFAS